VTVSANKTTELDDDAGGTLEWDGGGRAYFKRFTLRADLD
jgi:hypothetical protein